jgi:BirA family biotin operon repressor/biotin-[acetyl-CoA-carboxylase] ligase
MTSLAMELRAEGGDAAAVALDDLVAGAGPGRNALVAALLNGLHDSLRCFGESGWQPFLADWRAHDYLADRTVTVTRGSQPLQGIARGIAPDGSLLVETRSGVVPVVAGDVSLRSGG